MSYELSSFIDLTKFDYKSAAVDAQFLWNVVLLNFKFSFDLSAAWDKMQMYFVLLKYCLSQSILFLIVFGNRRFNANVRNVCPAVALSSD